MQTLEQSLSDLVLSGRVTEEDAMVKAPDKEAFIKFLREKEMSAAVGGTGQGAGAGMGQQPNPYALPNTGLGGVPQGSSFIGLGRR
jgi:hypothetical protein